MNFKYINFVDGPLATYRFDIFLEGSPQLKNNLIIFCSEFSYNLYSDYHNILEFVILDEIKSKYLSKDSIEKLPEYSNTEEWLEKINSFYSSGTDTYFPFDLHRFILPILAERGIFNFCIVDNDMLFYPDLDLHIRRFKEIPPGTLYSPFFDIHPNHDIRRKIFTEYLAPKFPQVNFNSDIKFRDSDGHTRGFHFKNKQDQLLYFEIWNAGIEILLQKEHRDIINIGGLKFQLEWFTAYLMQYFTTNFDYSFLDSNNLFHYEGVNVIVHKTRKEDTFYGIRYEDYDYSDTSSIKNFIQNNKAQIAEYWKNHVASFEITDTHVYTRLKP